MNQKDRLAVRKLFLRATLIAFAFVFVMPVFAQAPVPRFLPGDENKGNGPDVFAQTGGSGGTSNPGTFQGGIDAVGKIANQNGLTGAKSSKEILQTIVKWLLSLIGTIAVISLLYGGYLYISSQGEEGQVEKAKNIMLYSVIGIIIIGLSAVVVNVVINVATT